MSAVPEEALKEVAATNEPPNRLTSPEFFFLLQRIDRLDEKLSREIKEVDLKLSTRIDRVEEKIDRVQDRLDRLQDRVDLVQDRVDNIKFWAIGAVITLIVGFAGVILTLMQRL